MYLYIVGMGTKYRLKSQYIDFFFALNIEIYRCFIGSKVLKKKHR